MTQPSINAKRAAELRASGLSWRLVGQRLAVEEGRSLPYQAGSVLIAVTRHEKLTRDSDYYRITGRRIEA